MPDSFISTWEDQNPTTIHESAQARKKRNILQGDCKNGYKLQLNFILFYTE